MRIKKKLSKKLNIAIFHLGFFFSGGGEKLVINEAIGLAKRGHKVDIYAPVIDKKKCFPDIICKVNLKNLFIPSLIYFPLRDFISIIGAVIVTPFTFWRFYKYDVFYGANQPGPLICYLLTRLLRKPYIIYLAQPTRILYPREIDKKVGFGKGSFNSFFILTKILRPAIAFLDRISIRSADKILVNGEYIAKSIRKIYSVDVINCPASTYLPKEIVSTEDRLSGSIKLGKLAIRKPYMLVTNRHYPQKKFEYAVRTLRELSKSYHDLSLLITGQHTSYTDKLTDMVEQFGLKKKVSFLGFVNEKMLDSLYKNAVVYLYTSPEEDFGMGVIEAMATGTPVVAWRHGGPTVTIKNNESGYLAKPYNLRDFIDKTRKVLSNKSLARKLSGNSRRRARLFTYDIHNRMLEKTMYQAVR